MSKKYVLLSFFNDSSLLSQLIHNIFVMNESTEGNIKSRYLFLRSVVSRSHVKSVTCWMNLRNKCKEEWQYSESPKLMMLGDWRKQDVQHHLKPLSFVKPSANEKNANHDRCVFQLHVSRKKSSSRITLWFSMCYDLRGFYLISFQSQVSHLLS